MSEILQRKELCEDTISLQVKAPQIAKRHRPGQFVILRLDEKGERIPLTIADSTESSITLVFKEVGKTTMKLACLKEGDHILDLVGPLGNPAEIKEYGNVVCVGGGVGSAPLYPIARALEKEGNRVRMVMGARCEDYLFWRSAFREFCDLSVTTDDGSCGREGLVTEELEDILQEKEVDMVFSAGPLVMLSAVSETTREYDVPTRASLNPIMVDGTGMCGSCRVSVHGEIKFACVDGPEFDAHGVDFNELFHRNALYLEEEEQARERFEKNGCCGDHG